MELHHSQVCHTMSPRWTMYISKMYPHKVPCTPTVNFIPHCTAQLRSHLVSQLLKLCCDFQGSLLSISTHHFVNPSNTIHHSADYFPDQSEQEALRDELQDHGCEDQVDETQKVRLINFEQKGEKLNIKQEVEVQTNNKEEAEILDKRAEKQVDQELEKQINQRQEVEKQVDHTEAEKQVDQNKETEKRINQEEVEEQANQEKEAENQIGQKEEVEIKLYQEEEFVKVEQVNQKELDKNKENQVEEVNDHLQHKEHLYLKQDIVKEVNTQKAFQEEVSLQEKETDLQEESKEQTYQEQEVEEQVTYKREVKAQANNKVKEHLIQHEEHINHKQKYIENLDQKNAEVDWKERTNKGVPEYRRKSISESRHKWEELDKQQHQAILDNNRNLGERGGNIKFIEKELQTAGFIMSESKTSRFGGTNEKCAQCNRTVYAMEKMEVIGRVMHKTCFRCCKCNSPLSVGRFSVGGGNLYCLTHYKQAFREKGTYDVFTPDNPCKGKWQQNIDAPEAPKAQE